LSSIFILLFMDSAQNTRKQKISDFNPDGVGNTDGHIFGLPFTIEEAEVVIIPVPWDVTVSNSDGTSAGPENILQQSPQIDLYDEMVKAPWKVGIAMEEISAETLNLNSYLRPIAKKYIRSLEENPENQYVNHMVAIRNEINQACDVLSNKIREKALNYLRKHKLLVLIGGDHSTPWGLLQAINDFYPEFGILQIDAHADLRDAFMGFNQSHASIIHNASKLRSVRSFVQVGLRDICQQEADFIAHDHRFHAFFARELHQRGFRGESWKSICDDIISKLPQKVYISFDIDGLEPSQCPGTGTPVPGGLSYSAVLFLFEQLVASGKTIIGFDLVETGTQPIDGIVACRILYKTIALMLKSNHRV
jgi:agmatinase